MDDDRDAEIAERGSSRQASDQERHAAGHCRCHPDEGETEEAVVDGLGNGVPDGVKTAGAKDDEKNLCGHARPRIVAS